MATDAPIQPTRRPRVFFGWYVVAVAMLGAIFSTGMSQLVLSVVLKPITEEFGWSRTVVAGAATAGTITAGLLAVPMGRAVDAYGPRWLATGGAVITGLLYFAFAGLNEVWQFYLIYVLGRGVAAVAINGVVPTTAVANWFRRMRGRTMGLIQMCIPLGGAGLTLLAQWLIEISGWRALFVVLGITTLLVLVVPTAMFMRRRPEDMGLLPDGDLPVERREGAGARNSKRRRPLGEEVNWTYEEAVRTPSLWLLAAGGAIAAVAQGGVSFHQVPYYTDVGITAAYAAGVLSAYAAAGAVASMFWGYLTERVPERLLAISVMSASGVAILLLLLVREPLHALVWGIFFGVASRGGSTLLNIIIAQYYGRAAFGAISGVVQPFLMIGLGLGPLVVSIGFEATGSYRASFISSGLMAFFAAWLLWLAKRPVRKVAPIPPAPFPVGKGEI